MESSNNNDNTTSTPTNSTSITTNSTIKYDNKCPHHTTEDIVFICLDCDNEPACIECASSNHRKHDLLGIKKADEQLIIKIKQEFQEVSLPQLNKQLDNNQSILNQSNHRMKQIEDSHLVNLESVKQQFKQLHNILSITENDLIKQLITKLDENKDINIIIDASLHNIIDIINNILTLNNNNNNNNNNNHYDEHEEQFKQILKHNYQCKSLNNSNNNNDNQLTEYKDTTITINQDTINSIKDTLKSIIEINNTTTTIIEKQQTPTPAAVVLLKKELKTIECLGIDFTVYEDGDEIPDYTDNLAIEVGHHLPPVFPPSVDMLLLPDGFDCQSLQSLPSTIRFLFIFKIKYNLVPGSIPNSIEVLYFGYGFDQKIIQGIIPPSVIDVYLGDIVRPLDKDSIPRTVRDVYKSP